LQEKTTMKRFMLCTAGLIVFLFALLPLRADDLMQSAQQVFKPIPSVVPAVKGNAITREKIELGKMLFFDPRLSVSQIISCNSCHNLSTGGVDAGPTSIGHAWQKGPRRAPTVFDAVFNIAQFWDGRAEDLKAQAKGPIQASVEMNATPALVEKTLNSMPGYVEQFKKAFPQDAAPVTFDNVTKAIEAFEATLITPGSRFDQFLEGDANALNAQDKEGLKLGRGSLFPLWRDRKARRGDPAAERQGTFCRDQNGQRRICVPRGTAAQRRIASALLSFGPGLEPEASRGRHGREPAWAEAHRPGGKLYRRVPRNAHGRATQG
jgi:hypothetical protein